MPLSKKENAELTKAHMDAVIHEDPRSEGVASPATAVAVGTQLYSLPRPD